MSDAWQVSSLDKCLSKVIDCRGKTPKKLGGDWSKFGYRAISANNVKFDGLDKLDSINHADEGLYRKWMKEEIKKGDLLLTSEAPSGQVMIWDSNEKIILSQRVFGLRVRENICNRYLKYYLQSPIGQKEIVRNNSGSTVAGISAKAFSNILVRYPSKEHQIKIGGLLYSLDQKIAYNNRINAELEAMVRTLYDYWFVQFEFPDENGKPYKSSGGKMIYNSTLKREIPVSWKAAPLSLITPISIESINPADLPGKEYRHFSIPVFDRMKTYGLEYGKSIGSNKFYVKGTDLLVSKLNPWFNRVVYAIDEPDQICSTEFVVWRCPADEIKNFLYLVATSQQFISHCVQAATGTSNSHKRVNPTIMMCYEMPYKNDVAEKFGLKIDSFLKKMIANQKETKELIQLRDWLLPMLMNGQITVT